MHAGKSLVCDTPEAITQERNEATLEDAFISYLVEAEKANKKSSGQEPEEIISFTTRHKKETVSRFSIPGFNIQRLLTCSWRENLELIRDPVRAVLALFGALVLMLVMGFGINMDVENLTFAVLDHDQSEMSRNYALNISGSRYFIEKSPILNYDDLDKRMRSGEITMALEFPPKFGKEVDQGLTPEVGFWVDGAMPMRAETIQGYVQGIHFEWLAQQAQKNSLNAAPTASLETRYRYNPDVESLPAMVPAVIPILLMMIPAILAALAVVREKEMGSIINLYVTPLSRAEFLLGKQLPYVLFSSVSFLLLLLMAVLVFDVPIKGSLPTLALGLLLYCIISTGMGLLASSITRSQIAVMFLTMIGTLLPATQFCGLINPVSTLQGMGRFIGYIYPTTHMLLISRGVFNKALNFSDLHGPMFALAITIPIILGLGIILQKKQAS